MSNYNGRRGPMVSSALRNLNVISPEDTTGGKEFFMDDSSLGNNFLFSNTQFLDLDSGQNTDFQPQPVKQDVALAPSTPNVEDPSAVMGEMSGIDFMHGDYEFNEFAYPGSSIPFADNFQSIQPSHGPVFNNQITAPQHSQFSQTTQAKSSEKRKSDIAATPAPTINLEEDARLAAEEDKRRRNTQASARFRVKKKQREQALEKSAKEMSDKVSSLESKVSQLETENKWLKNLLVEKNEGSENIMALWKDFVRQAAQKNQVDEIR